MRLNISVPDALAKEARERGLPVSALCQAALRAALDSPGDLPPRFRVRVAGREAEETFDVAVVPRIGELVAGKSYAAARVADVRHDLTSGGITVFVQ